MGVNLELVTHLWAVEVVGAVEVGVVLAVEAEVEEADLWVGAGGLWEDVEEVEACILVVAAVAEGEAGTH